MTSAKQTPDEVTALRELVSSLQKENSLLRQKIDALCRRVFGSSSEKIDAAQLELLLQLVNSGAAEVQPAPVVEKLPNLFAHAKSARRVCRKICRSSNRSSSRRK